jgi:hypothetical protein
MGTWETVWSLLFALRGGVVDPNATDLDDPQATFEAFERDRL